MAGGYIRTALGDAIYGRESDFEPRSKGTSPTGTTQSVRFLKYSILAYYNLIYLLICIIGRRFGALEIRTRWRFYSKPRNTTVRFAKDTSRSIRRDAMRKLIKRNDLTIARRTPKNKNKRSKPQVSALFHSVSIEV